MSSNEIVTLINALGLDPKTDEIGSPGMTLKATKINIVMPTRVGIEINRLRRIYCCIPISF